MIAFGAKYRAFDDADHGPVGLSGDPGSDAIANRLVDRRIAHDTALANMLAAGFELGLDQRDQCGALGSERERRRQNRRETDKTRVAGNDVDRLGDLPARQRAGVQALMDDDARVLAQFPSELTMTDINGVNPARAALQQHVGKPAGRSADIQCGPTRYLDAKMIERMNELNAAARDPRVIAALDRQCNIDRDLVASLVDPPAAGIDETSKDQRLRPGPAFRQAPLGEKLIGPPLRRQSERSYARAGCSAISRPSADKAVATMWRALSPA